MPGMQRDRISVGKAARDAGSENLSGTMRAVRRQRSDNGVELNIREQMSSGALPI
jgi:hypothetical protein